MKPIEDVIKAMVMCITTAKCPDGCPYYHETCLKHEIEKDAIYYLREYADLMDKIERTFVEEDRKHAGKLE